ncbi:hypothetical protein SORBI_3003G215900 [Sorghum bicolor]|uniref:Uncharacterized protein n=1 Tax=Sorghum bicolor TaxID=4558 RepID=A0A1B6Q4M4_SORBI|nr:hypothetical protein SORBI_3003G215900 [Sorghum bicolor]
MAVASVAMAPSVGGMEPAITLDQIYLWQREHPWNLEADTIVNSSNTLVVVSNLDEAHSSPRLHAAAGPGLIEECATFGGCHIGTPKMTNAYDLRARCM